MKKIGTDVSAPRRGEASVCELENPKSIISKYAIYLEEQDDHKILSFRRTDNSWPDAGNFTFEIIRKRL